MNIDEKTKNKIIYTILGVIPDVKIYLFGSRARGDYRPDSDIDIALEGKEKLDRYAIGEIRDMLQASNILKKIDIVDLNSVNNEMKDSILKEAVLWKS